MRKSIAIIVITLLMSACATVGVTQMKSDVTPKKDGCKLDVYSAEKEIEHSYEVVCLIDSKTGGNAFADKTMAGAISLAKPAACRCGADAILISGGRAEGVTLFTWGEGFATMKALRYVRDDDEE